MSQTGTQGYSGIRLGADRFSGKLLTDLTDGGRLTRALVSDFIITDGQWHEIRLVWDGSLRHLFVDNVEVAVDTKPLAHLRPSRGGLHLGTAKTPDPGTFWTGSIDDVRIYEGALLP